MYIIVGWVWSSVGVDVLFLVPPPFVVPPSGGRFVLSSAAFMPFRHLKLVIKN